jgi:hypothetical protein
VLFEDGRTEKIIKKVYLEGDQFLGYVLSNVRKVTASGSVLRLKIVEKKYLSHLAIWRQTQRDGIRETESWCTTNGTYLILYNFYCYCNT